MSSQGLVAHTCDPQEADIRWITVRSQPRQIVRESISKKPITKKGLVEWLKW
jgi:hypothetical protein